MKRSIRAIFLIFLLCSTPAFALGEWCGSRQHGDLNNLIPDSFRPADVPIAYTLCGYLPGGPAANFRPSCRAHDLCYWIHGLDKKVCDSQFRDSLEAECRETYHASHRKNHKACCIKAAFYYELAVERMGGDSYRAAQAEGEACADLYAIKTGKIPSFPLKKQMAESCMIHNNANGQCYVETVVDMVIGG